MSKPMKEMIISEYQNRFGELDSAVLVEIRGMDANKNNELRGELAETCRRSRRRVDDSCVLYFFQNNFKRCNDRRLDFSFNVLYYITSCAYFLSLILDLCTQSLPRPCFSRSASTISSAPLPSECA